MKKSNNTIGNRSRDLPACSVVSQPTAPPRALLLVCFGYLTKPISYSFITCPHRRLQKVMCYRLSVRMEKPNPSCGNFQEILYNGRVLKSVHQIQVWLN
jgi:hypothetical protein